MGARAIAVVGMLLAELASLEVWGQGRAGASAYAQAAALLQKGDSAEAERVLQADLRNHPKHINDLDLLGTILDVQKRYDEAEEIYFRALRIEPESPSLLNNLGNHYAMRGQLERAHSTYLRVVRIDPHHVNANLHLAQMCVAQNKDRQALEYLDNLPEPDRSSPTAQLLRAQALHSCGEQAAGTSVLKRLEAQHAENLQVMFSVGLTYADWHLYDEAERLFTRVLASDPTDADLLYNLGLASTHTGHLNRAEAAFEAVLKQRANDVDAILGLARVYTAQSQDQRALDLLTIARRLAPERRDILYFLTQVEEKQGLYEESAKVLDEYLKWQPNDPVAKREVAFALAHTVQFDRGVAQLRSYVAANAQDSVGLYELGLVESLSAREKTLYHLNQAIALDPDLLEARYARAVLNYQTGKASEAVGDLLFVLKKDPRDYAALDLLGVAQIASNHEEDAFASFRQAAQLAAKDARILMHYSRALLRADQVAESKTVVRQLEGLSRGYGPIQLFVSVGARQDEEAESGIYEERVTPVDSKGAYLQMQSAERQLAKGETVAALKAFHGILENTSDAVILAACGKLLLEKRQYAEARKFLEKAIAAPTPPPDLRLDLATAVYHTEGVHAALACLELTRIEQRGGDWYVLAAQLLISSGMYKEAIAYLNQGLAASPTRRDLIFETARLLLNYGTAHSQYDEALDFLQKAEHVFPTDPKLLLCHAILSALSGRTGDAEKTLAEMELRWPDWGRPYLVHGIVLVNSSRFNEAKPLIEASVGLGDSDPLAYFNLALANFNSYPTEVEGAERAISQALRLAPEDPYIQWLAGKISYAMRNYEVAVQHLQAAVKSRPEMVEAHMQLSATYRAMGEEGKSLAELKEVLRIKQSRQGSVATPLLPTTSVQNILTSIQFPP